MNVWSLVGPEDRAVPYQQNYFISNLSYIIVPINMEEWVRGGKERLPP